MTTDPAERIATVLDLVQVRVTSPPNLVPVSLSVNGVAMTETQFIQFATIFAVDPAALLRAARGRE